MSSFRGPDGDRRYNSYRGQIERTCFGNHISEEQCTGHTTQHPFARRDEDWRSSDFTRRSGTAQNSSHGSWKSACPKPWKCPPCNPWVNEKETLPRRNEDWRNENSWRSPSSPVFRTMVAEISGENVGDKTSLSSEIKEWSENSSGRDSSLRTKKNSIKGLSDAELEKAAHLQLKLMAEMKDEVDNLSGRECGHPKNEEKNDILQGYKVYDKSETVEAKAIVSDSKYRSYMLERNTAHSSHAGRDKRCHMENELSKLNSGGLMVLKSNFEEVHMLTRNNRAGATLVHKPEAKEENWYEDYLKNVNRRKAELRNSLPGPAYLFPSAATCEMQRRPKSRSSTDVQHHPGSFFLGGRPTPCDNLTMPESTTRSPVMPKEREMDLQSKSSNTIDPNQYVEELSDSEDWDEIAQLVCKPKLKRPLDCSSEQPRKRCLLDLGPDLSPSYNGVGQSPHLQYDRSATASASRELHSVERKPQSPRSSIEEFQKSYFRIEYPSMQQGTYLSQPSFAHWAHRGNDSSRGASEPFRMAVCHKDRIGFATSQSRDLDGRGQLDWRRH